MCLVVLFDIDGTLVDVKGAGSRSIRNALREMTGLADGFSEIDVEGKTGLEIIRDEFSHAGIPLERILVERVVSAYLEHLEREIEIRPGEVLPGVVQLLRDFAEIDYVFLALLTGNFKRGARLKLRSFDLNRYFEVGAFGDDDEERNHLLPIALRRLAGHFRVLVQYGQCVVVGDTPRDVRCAAVHGGRSIAVCTGKYTREELVASGADLILPDLSNAGKVIDFLEL
jgi:phosphoglycolate phosphatase-like HAD superfamily hydrolase